MKKIAALLAFAFVFTLAGCETMKGLGEDIQSAGEAIEKKAKEASE